MEHADFNSSKAVVILVLICGTNQTNMILLHCRTKWEDVEGDHGAAAPICRDCSKIFFEWYFGIALGLLYLCQRLSGLTNKCEPMINCHNTTSQSV